MATYDSRPDTLEYIKNVQAILGKVIDELSRRADVHDSSKLESPEKEAFDEYTPKLKGSTYGSDEYKSFLAGMGDGLRHHYAVNDHHPEYFRWFCPACNGSWSESQAPECQWDDGSTHRWCPRCCSHGGVIWEAELSEKPERGIAAMSLVHLIEMLCDWKAATLRHADGDIAQSIEKGQQRFGYSDELKRVLLNTVPFI